jgi:hypothetical protein
MLQLPFTRCSFSFVLARLLSQGEGHPKLLDPQFPLFFSEAFWIFTLMRAAISPPYIIHREREREIVLGYNLVSKVVERFRNLAIYTQ